MILSCRFGRDNFQESMRLSAKADMSEIDWKSFKYMVFDVPTNHGTYAERYAQLGTNCAIRLHHAAADPFHFSGRHGKES